MTRDEAPTKTVMYAVRWKTAEHKAFDGSVMQEAGEWRYYTVVDDWSSGAHHVNASKPVATHAEAVDLRDRLFADAKGKAFFCTWYDMPSRKNPEFEIVEVTPQYQSYCVGYQFANHLGDYPLDAGVAARLGL